MSYSRFKLMHEEIIDVIKKYTGKSNIFVKEIRMINGFTDIEYYILDHRYGLRTEKITLLNKFLFK
ncbi:MAG: hypothetical protein ACTSWG_10415 [Candidatus Helarchaeota archaeon]